MTIQRVQESSKSELSSRFLSTSKFGPLRKTSAQGHARLFAQGQGWLIFSIQYSNHGSQYLAPQVPSPSASGCAGGWPRGCVGRAAGWPRGEKISRAKKIAGRRPAIFFASAARTVGRADVSPKAKKRIAEGEKTYRRRRKNVSPKAKKLIF